MADREQPETAPDQASQPPGIGGIRLMDSLFRPGEGSSTPAPWRLLAPLLILAWTARAAVAMIGDFMLHPDEIYQYLEPAHGIVYGSSIITWEMATGARSFLIPGFVAGILYVLKFLGIDTPDGYIPGVKLVLSLASLALPIAMYYITRSLWSERAGLIAFVLGCFWYEFVGFAHKPLSDMLSCYAAMATIALACARARTRTTIGLAGFAAAIAIGLRWQIGVMLVPFSILLLADLDTRGRLYYVGLGVAGMALVGLIDHLAWGGFFHSFQLNIQSNLEANKMLSIDGQASNIHYFYWTAWSSLGLFWIAMAAGIAGFRRYSLFLVLAVIFFAVHVQLPHKEYRFAFPWIPLWLMIASDQIDWLARLCKKRKIPEAVSLGVAGALAATISAAGIANALPRQNELYLGYSLEQIHISFLEPDPHLTLYRKLSKDNSVEGILEQARPITSTGGFYYLHRKAAILPPQVLDQIRERTSKFPDMRNWFTHLVLGPNTTPIPGFYLTERKSDYDLYKIQPAFRTKVFPLREHVYSVDLPFMMMALPHLRKHLPEDQDFKIDFINPK